MYRGRQHAQAQREGGLRHAARLDDRCDRRGDVLSEVGNAEDICDMPRPEGLRLSWLLRARGEALWDRLAGMEPPAGPDRYVWIAAEKDLVRKAKARFRDTLGVGPDEGYFAYYWTA